MKRFGFLAALLASALVPMSANAAASTFGPTAGAIPFLIDESAQRFDVPGETILVRPGYTSLATIVPKTATGKHGIGIDGGAYSNVLGYPVTPGHSTTLSLELEPGNYTLFDSFEENRSRGYSLKLKVLKRHGGKWRYGKSCGIRPFGAVFSAYTTWTIGTTCTSAGKLRRKLNAEWDAAETGWSDIVVLGYTCSFNPYAPSGLKIKCVNGRHTVTIAGAST